MIMKELSVEQKAKAYDEAISVAKKFYTPDSNNVNLKATLEMIFPELKESDDEKMREMAIKAVYAPEAQSCIKSWGINPDDVIAWLEKQGEQKPVQEIEPAPIFKIGDILKRKGKDYTFRVDRIQGGYYHCDRNHGAFFPIKEQGNWELVEQKSIEWSEEDKETIDYLIDYLESELDSSYTDLDKETFTKEINWLKSLRPQSQVEAE